MKSTGINIIGLSILLILSVTLKAQTAGNLTFACTTAAPSGSWGNKHVLAIWIEDTKNPSVFIKTKAKYGYEDDHLTSWLPKSGGSLVDAVTGATLSAYGKQTVIWNGTDIKGNVVADGNYNVFIEMGWGKDKVAQHSVVSFTFAKSNNEVHLTPAGTTNYSNITVDWVPAVTLVGSVDNPEEITVYPNPTKGPVTLKFSGNQSAAKLVVENSSGSSVFQKNIEKGFTGLVNIDLSAFSNGIYFVKIADRENQFVYKVLLNK